MVLCHQRVCVQDLGHWKSYTEAGVKPPAIVVADVVPEELMCVDNGTCPLKVRIVETVMI